MRPLEQTPFYIYLLSLVLAVPLSGFVVSLVADEAPGFVVMIGTAVFTVVIAELLSRLRRRLVKRG